MRQAVLVCGGCGYIGSHTVLELLRTQQYDIIILDNLSAGYSKSLERIKEYQQQQQLQGEITLVVGDVSDKSLLQQVFTKHSHIIAVFHFCAKISVPESVSQPLEYYQNNVVATLNLLQVMDQFKIRHFVFSSTAAIFGVPTKVPIETDDTQQPINPYGETKLAVEKLLRWYAESTQNQFQYVCLRYFNACGADETVLIGEAHKPETHLIPIILQVALKQRSHITVFGKDYSDTKDGTCVRDYIHVTDLASAHIQALQYMLQNEKQSGCFNLGSGLGYTVLEVIEACRTVTGKEIAVQFGERRAGDPSQLIASSSKAEQVLQWRRKYDTIESIVKSAWKWHSQQPNGYDE